METLFLNRKLSLKTVPKIGILLFLAFYSVSVILYAYELRQFTSANVITIWNGYLCDLLDLQVLDLAPNPARPFAIIALWSMCFGILFLWRNMVFSLQPYHKWQRLIWYGFAQVSVFSLLSLPFGSHDGVILLSGTFGAVSVLFLCMTLKYNGYRKPYVCGMLFLTVFILNYLFYLFDLFTYVLPFIQKITFSTFIVWYLLLDIMVTNNHAHLKKHL